MYDVNLDMEINLFVNEGFVDTFMFLDLWSKNLKFLIWGKKINN